MIRSQWFRVQNALPTHTHNQFSTWNHVDWTTIGGDRNANDNTLIKRAPGWWIFKMTMTKEQSCVFRVREAKSNTNTYQQRDQGVFLASWNWKRETHGRRTDSTTAMAGMWDRQRTDLVPRDHLPSVTQKYLTSSSSHLVLDVLKKRWRVHES